MAFSVVMPALEMAQETGKLIAWRKKEGDRVTKGEPLLEIETDKAVMEVEAPADGILAGITGRSGADIPVGQTIAWIVAPGEKPPAENESAATAPRQRRRKPESHAAPVAAAAPGHLRPFRARGFPRRRGALRKNWAWISPRCAAPARAARFLRRTCKQRPARAVQLRRTRQEISQPRSAQHSSAASWPNAPRRAGRPFLTFLSRVKSMPSRLTNIARKLVAEDRTHAQYPHHAYGSAGRTSGARAAQASAIEFKLDRRRAFVFTIT